MDLSNKAAILAQAKELCQNTLMDTLAIEMIDYGADYVVGKMPVTPRVHQPDGILHGGATLALAESVGSFAATLFFDSKTHAVRGIELSANHLKSVSDGYVYATARLIHSGRSTQLFEIKVTDASKALISLCKLTTIRLPRTR